MKANAVVAFPCLSAFQAASQDGPKAVREAQCKFSSGKMIAITFPAERTGTARLLTDGDLVTLKGINIFAGDYTGFPTRDAHNNWSFHMRTRSAKGQSLDSAPVPLSVTRSALPAGSFNISFDHTGGSCMMHWDSENSKVQLSLEFTEKNADLPLAQ